MKTASKTRLTSLALLLTAAAACATLGEEGGGGHNLPNRGIVGYDKVAIDHDGDEETDPLPFVLTPDDPDTVRYHSPSALSLPSGDIALYVAVHQAQVMDGDEVLIPESWSIARTLSSDGGMSFGQVATVLTTQDTPDYVGERIGSPSVVRDGDQVVMAFEYGEREGIALATSDDGLDFVVDEAPALKAGGKHLEVGGPSLVIGPNGRELFFDATLSDERRVIVRSAYDAEAEKFGSRLTILAPPAIDCLDEYGDIMGCWDRLAVFDAEVRIAKTGAGARVYRMLYAGVRKSAASIGFAASFDGLEWERSSLNPVVGTDDDDDDEVEPTNLLHGDRYLLFAEEEDGISLAISDHGWPSERF